MAIDTALKRYSIIGLSSPAPRLLPIPDGTIAQADRQIFLFLYSGILAAEADETASVVLVHASFGKKRIIE